MLNREAVAEEEQRLREALARLPDERRARTYRELQKRLKDPDTYAALNWFFMGGLHHFYLGCWGRGLIDLGVVLLGLALLFTPLFVLGLLCWLGIAIWELANLFRSQIIVQDWNNRMTAQLLQEPARNDAPSM